MPKYHNHIKATHYLSVVSPLPENTGSPGLGFDQIVVLHKGPDLKSNEVKGTIDLVLEMGRVGDEPHLNRI